MPVSLDGLAPHARRQMWVPTLKVRYSDRDEARQDLRIQCPLQGPSQIQVNSARCAPTSESQAADLADEVKGMYRVLELISESGTNGSGKGRPSYPRKPGLRYTDFEMLT